MLREAEPDEPDDPDDEELDVLVEVLLRGVAGAFSCCTVALLAARAALLVVGCAI